MKALKQHAASALVAAAVVVLTAAIAGAAVNFVYPADKTWVPRSDYLVLKTNSPDITAVKISINDVAGEIMEVGTPEYRKAFRDIVIVEPAWDPGRNIVKVVAYQGKQQAETVSADIFFLPDKTAAGVPPEYRPFVMHVPEREKVCAQCHGMNPTPEQYNVNDQKQNPCFSCHKKILQNKFVHGPAGTTTCAYCHASAGGQKYAAKKRDAELCYECHAEKRAEFAGRKFLHGPIAAGMCEVCHDPHGSGSYAQLKQPVNRLCLSCHGDVGREPHVSRTSSGAGHPLSGKPDPSKPGTGRELSCVSCHNPHGGAARYLFANNQEGRMQLCQMCHNK